ncbi:MAG: NAD(P)/FAD-dependent oxidoreductase [Candidatus Peribacteraceae bacterium]|nr:NAD(P)/FAD-dependent oxidoreductase [Candidatus Peribacteraceae bacterium]MDD5739481.1 NAD(P)/FAD-dependent oxidoreductase [Candidatus Peribacteraceae bacterium]
MQDRFDAIIIGMGPAGLQCARTLKNTGKSVLIIDRKTVIGPKPCGGGLTYQDEPFGIPESISRPASTHIIRIGKHETTIHLHHPLRSITRLDLGQFLLKEITGVPNISVLTDTKVTEIHKDSAVTDKGTFSFKTLVGADGTDSMVRRFLKLPKKITLGFTFDIPVKTDKVLWYFNPPGLKTAYFWFFPKQENVTNVGGYYDPDEISFEKVLEEFKAFMTDMGFPFSLDQLKGAPLGVLYKGVAFGNIYLAGEAAGMTEALTGEGIAFALTSGQEVAKRILDPSYPMPELERILALKRLREGMLARARKHPRFQKWIFRMGARMLKNSKYQLRFGT